MLSAVYAVVVCLSVSLSPCACVCVSATLRYCIKMAKRRIVQIMLHDRPGTQMGCFVAVEFLLTSTLRVWRILSNISRCNGPIFTLFSPYESALRAHDASLPLFSICQETLPWQPNNEGKLILRAFFARSPDSSTVSFCYDLLLMPLYCIKFW